MYTSTKRQERLQGHQEGNLLSSQGAFPSTDIITHTDGNFVGNPTENKQTAKEVPCIISRCLPRLTPKQEEWRTCLRCEHELLLVHFPQDKAGFHPLRTRFCHPCYHRLYNIVKLHSKRAEGTLTIGSWMEMLEASEGYCSYCQEHVGIAHLTVEHIIPRSQGGTNDRDNIAAVCEHCNKSKLGRGVEEWQRSTEAKRLRKELQAHLGLSAFEVTNLAIKTLAQQVGLVEGEEK